MGGLLFLLQQLLQLDFVPGGTAANVAVWLLFAFFSLRSRVFGVFDARRPDSKGAGCASWHRFVVLPLLCCLDLSFFCSMTPRTPRTPSCHTTTALRSTLGDPLSGTPSVEGVPGVCDAIALPATALPARCQAAGLAYNGRM